ncbi:MAG TPA: homoserine dehydrogenase, partial [Gammaproteobacteria bacterium]|nr:homoserine dehydrogenase [Gammaproteobacteria bacterium]
MDSETVNIALLGLGTVGGGTLQILQRHADAIERRTGRRVKVRRALVRDPSKPRPPEAADIAVTTDINEILDDPSISIVAELVGGCDPTRDWIMRAITSGKHVITANKALIAQHGNELFAAADKHGVIVAFEAAVGGGIPIIKTIREALAGNDIQSVAGIVNGTTNYILTQMRDSVPEGFG